MEGEGEFSPSLWEMDKIHRSITPVPNKLLYVIKLEISFKLHHAVPSGRKSGQSNTFD